MGCYSQQWAHQVYFLERELSNRQANLDCTDAGQPKEAKMALKKITNISKIHLGTSKPSSLFLRRSVEGQDNPQSSAVIDESLVDDKMRLWESRGMLKIEDAEKGEKKTPSNKFEIAATPSMSSSSDNVTVDVEKTHVIEPTATEQVPTVSSGEGGDVIVNDPEADDDDDGDPPFATAKKSAPAYTKESLKAMKIKNLRNLVSDLGIEAKSNKKKDIIKAILG